MSVTTGREGVYVPVYLAARRAREGEMTRKRSQHECDNHDDLCWPSIDTVTSEATGELAERCRAMLGVTDPAVPVYLDEVEDCNGYSEYTRETDYSITVRCGDNSWSSEDSCRHNGLEQLLLALDKSEAKR